MIRELTIPPRVLELEGLAPNAKTLRDLRSIVLLVGANGSGKTRFLRSLTRTINWAGEWCTVDSKVERSVETFEMLRRRMEDRTTTPEEVDSIKYLLGKHEAYLGIKVNGPSGLEPLNVPRPVIHLTYQLSHEILNAEDESPHGIESAVKATRTAGFDSAYQNMHAYLTAVARHLFNAGHMDLQQRTEVESQKRDADDFNRIVTALLGAPIDWTPQPETGVPIPLIMGRNFNADELSAGQRILLAWAIILHRQREHLGNAIVIIDEPENHLHPDVCIRALDKLQNDVLGDQGQIWLATHSIPLIAWAGFDAIYFAHDGRVEYKGNGVDEVVNGLVGGAEGRKRLRSFLADAENLAFLKFAAECLNEPAVAYTKANDQQETAFAKLVANRAAAGRPLRLLDFGAGHGRLAMAISVARRKESGSPKELPRLQFLAYDRGLRDDTCQHQLNDLSAQPGVEANYVDNLQTLHDAKDKVDVAVLCNVLHEISVDEWLKTFADLYGVLASDGCVVLMEDQTPSVGELPSHNGFVILDAMEAKRLFANDDGVRVVPNVVSEGWEFRLTVIEIPRQALSKATATTIGQALQDVRERAEKEIAKLRHSPPDTIMTFQSGRLHALYAMLWVNAMMAADAFGPPRR